MQAVTTNWLKRGGRRESQEVVFVHNNWSTVRLDPWDPGSINTGLMRLQKIARSCRCRGIQLFLTVHSWSGLLELRCTPTGAIDMVKELNWFLGFWYSLSKQLCDLFKGWDLSHRGWFRHGIISKAVTLGFYAILTSPLSYGICPLIPSSTEWIASSNAAPQAIRNWRTQMMSHAICCVAKTEQ